MEQQHQNSFHSNGNNENSVFVGLGFMDIFISQAKLREIRCCHYHPFTGTTSYNHLGGQCLEFPSHQITLFSQQLLAKNEGFLKILLNFFPVSNISKCHASSPLTSRKTCKIPNLFQCLTEN